MAHRYDRSYDGRRDRSYDRRDRSHDPRGRSPTYSPDRSYQGDDDHDNRLLYWLPDKGIDYQVICADLGCYLGPEATVVRLHHKVGTSLFRPLSS